MQEETVWLTQQGMAELFGTSQQNISQHVISIYDEGELDREATHKKYLSVRQEGKREVRREVAKQKAHEEYAVFRARRLEEPSDVEKDFVEAEKQMKRLEKGGDHGDA
jgi:hypothetical protein